MSTDPHLHLNVEPDAIPVLVFALQRTIDDLEARALVAAQHDPDLGVASAGEYRIDGLRLAGMLRQLGHDARPPDPGRAAVVWFDDTYTIGPDRQPVRMAPVADLTRIVDEAVRRRSSGRLSATGIVELLADATGLPAWEVADQLVAARRAGHKPDLHPERQIGRTGARELSRDLPGPESSTR